MKLLRVGSWVAAGLAVAIGVAGLLLFQIRRPHSNAVMRGYQLAGQLGCFGCHGQGGTGGVPNPGSDEGEIPAWDGGMLMMYVESEEEIAEWILFGRPKRLQDAAPSERLVDMPAYREHLDQREIDDLIAYVKAAGAYGTSSPPELAARGLRTAARLGCFGCHRGQGRLGTPNPGSFKGYIPPWSGPDFEELVRDEEELRTWILQGGIERFASDPMARFFTARQVIQMPGYEERLEPGDLDALVAYVQWVAANPIEWRPASDQPAAGQ